MDGVIVDTEPVHHYAYQQHFKELGIVVTDEMYAGFTGNSTRNVFQKLKATFDLNDDVETLILRKRALFNEAFDTKPDLELIDGVLALIVELHEKGMELIVASSASKSTINRVFNRFNLHQYFTHIVSGEDFPKSKPDPAIFIHAANLSLHSNENCIVIEDSTNGILAAKAAQLFCVGYDSVNSKLQNYDSADLVISQFEDLNFDRIKNLDN